MTQTERWEDLQEYNEPVSEQVDVLDAMIQREEQDALWELVKELTQEEQRVLVMRHVYDLSYAEIAKQLNYVSEGACRQAHYRILNKLKLKAQEADLWSAVTQGKFGGKSKRI